MEELPPIELMKTSTTKNDTPNKFWASVEPYCAPFTEDDLKVWEIKEGAIFKMFSFKVFDLPSW